MDSSNLTAKQLILRQLYSFKNNSLKNNLGINFLINNELTHIKESDINDTISVTVCQLNKKSE